MTAEAGQRAVPIPAGQAEYLIGTAPGAVGTQHAAVAVPSRRVRDQAVCRPAP